MSSHEPPEPLAFVTAEDILRTIYGDDLTGCTVSLDAIAAIIDRVLERGRLLLLDGPSMRTKHLGLDAPAHAAAGSPDVVRISGIQRSEFPEPTRIVSGGEIARAIDVSE